MNDPFIETAQQPSSIMNKVGIPYARVTVFPTETCAFYCLIHAARPPRTELRLRVSFNWSWLSSPHGGSIRGARNSVPQML